MVNPIFSERELAQKVKEAFGPSKEMTTHFQKIILGNWMVNVLPSYQALSAVNQILSKK